VERALRDIAMSTDPAVVEMNARCGVPPVILGICTSRSHGTSSLFNSEGKLTCQRQCQCMRY
jgi:hypothetical protein